MRSTFGARAVTGQLDVYAAPLQGWQTPGSLPGVICCHGWGSNTAIFTDSTWGAGVYPLFDAIRNQYAAAAGDFDGNAWGNDAAIADVASMKTWMQTMGAKSGKVALLGVSMGTLTALNFAYKYPSLVACVAVFLPVVDLTSIYAAAPTMQATIDSAYSPAYDDATHGPTHNPIRYAANLNVPVRLWYSTADNVALPGAVETFTAACPTATATIASTTLGHTLDVVAATPIKDVLAFIAANLS